MTDDTMLYDRSNMPSGRGVPSSEPKLSADPTRGPVSGADRESMSYPSLSSQGLVEIEIPLRNVGSGPFRVAKVLVRNVGQHISRHVEARLPTGDAHLEFSHFVGVVKAQELLSADAQRRMDNLATRLAGSRNPEIIFTEEIQPWLASLQPKAR